MHKLSPAQSGFSLLELAIVLVIVALISGGLLLGLSAQRDITANQDVERQLESIKEALLAYAITNGRLPCPAIPTLANTAVNAGLEDRPNTNSACNLIHGVLPWATLGIQEIDPWGQRFTYFASSKFTQPLSAGTLASFNLETAVPPANSGTANIKSTSTSTSNIASDLAAVIVSHGALGAGGYTTSGGRIDLPSDLDELENTKATQTFVSHTQTSNFNDHLVWITPNQLKSRLVAVGKLP